MTDETKEAYDKAMEWVAAANAMGGAYAPIRAHVEAQDKRIAELENERDELKTRNKGLEHTVLRVDTLFQALRKRIESAPKMWLYRIHGNYFVRDAQHGPPEPGVLTDLRLVHAVRVEENKCSLCGMTEKEHADDLCAAIYSLRSRGIEQEEE